MKQRVADYIADFLVEHGITDVFSVVGGGAMHLNDAFGHHPKLQCTYNHHEQACSIAAEGYFRCSGKLAAVCVTSGPGAVNVLNGVAGAYQDSVPMIVFSGQAKESLTVKHYKNIHLRTLGNQEIDIVSSIGNMTKYAEKITDPTKILYCLEKAFYIAINGRKGPCWLDIPLDIQGMIIEVDNLKKYKPRQNRDIDLANVIDVVRERFIKSKRPVLYAGNGIRLAGALSLFRDFVEKWRIPVVTCWDSIDLIPTDNHLYCGRAGTMGDRAGNFAVQNSDFLLCVGTRLNLYQVGFNLQTWARMAYIVVVDIDSEELRKPTIRVDLPICCDAGFFLKQLLTKDVVEEKVEWIDQCIKWKKTYPVVTEKQKKEDGLVNVYAFFDKISRLLPVDSVNVVSNGSASVVGSASFFITDCTRFIMNCAFSSMGYGLPAAIGACIANKKKHVFCFEGDGSIMMNLQELQTMVTNKLPIKLFVINNNGYHQIRLTQSNVFNNGFVGIGNESGDLSFPDYKKIAEAFEIPYVRIDDNLNQNEKLLEVINYKSFIMCEIFVTTTQKFEPKSATKKLEDGSLFSPPLEDLAPFLSREELKKNMFIPLVEEVH